jgi:hypothetical protein
MKNFNKAFEEPFSFLYGGKSYWEEDHYNYSDICITLFNKNMKSEKIDMSNVILPRDITKVYWYREGKNDEESWNMIGKIKIKDKEKYIYYVAWCDYTGFDCQGGMKLYVSKSLSKLLTLAVENDVYSMIYDNMNNNKLK